MYFKKFTVEDEQRIQNYLLTEDQLLYTASPREVIKIEDHERHPILAMDDNLFVTFFVLHEGQGPLEFLGTRDDLLLRSFSTDVRYEGRGYATKVLEKIPSYVQENFPHIKRIILAVNEGNERARALYIKQGYTDTELRMPGRTSNLHILQYSFV
ncbi:GNAT family N-acetyltransferase [Kurthia gibsonii]|uniref:GNAT family N-acetyltransferase n=1 Tax=Kurthia gibsonii TaxID=33946 RepID=UPI002DBFC8FC|nr:GNAT family N-acetyltransferase [Kurthia gibsonii]MEB7772912.1 GNAT family N-acetyltransferase [Kurthia gibsonii]